MLNPLFQRGSLLQRSTKTAKNPTWSVTIILFLPAFPSQEAAFYMPLHPI
jgi:hypothetical protein